MARSPIGILPHPQPPEGGFDLTPALSRKRERGNSAGCLAEKLFDGDGLRQIARLIHIGPAQHRDVVREHLQRHGEHRRRN